MNYDYAANVKKPVSRCIVAGSFDPITLGHIDVINRAKNDFEIVYVVALINEAKQGLFSLEERKEILDYLFSDDEQVISDSYDGLTINYCRKHGISIIIRGFRGSVDYEYESEMAKYNRENGGIETLLIPAVDGREIVSSSTVRVALENGDDLSNLLPKKIINKVKQIYKRKGKKK